MQSALQNLEFNVRSLRRFAAMGYTIVAMQPSCSHMMKVDYPWLDDGDATRTVAQATMDLSEYLMSLHEKRVLGRTFDAAAGRILYHVPCHLRAQGLGQTARDLLNLIPGAEIEVAEACAGMGERWGMDRDHYAASLEVAQPLLERLEEHRHDAAVSDCVRAGVQIRQETGRNVLHPAEVLRYAFGLSLDV